MERNSSISFWKLNGKTLSLARGICVSWTVDWLQSCVKFRTFQRIPCKFQQRSVNDNKIWLRLSLFRLVRSIRRNLEISRSRKARKLCEFQSICKWINSPSSRRLHTPCNLLLISCECVIVCVCRHAFHACCQFICFVMELFCVVVCVHSTSLRRFVTSQTQRCFARIQFTTSWNKCS